MVLLSPLPHRHLNHCQIQQTGLWNSSAPLHISLPTGYTRGGCTKAGDQEVQLLPQHCPASAIALLHRGTCSISRTGWIHLPTGCTRGTGSQTQPSWSYLILASYFSLFLFLRAQHTGSWLQEEPGLLCHRAHHRVYTTRTYPTSHGLKTHLLPFSPQPQKQTNIRKWFCMASAVSWDFIHVIFWIQVGCMISAISKFSNKRVMFLSSKHTKFLYYNVSDGSNPY